MAVNKIVVNSADASDGGSEWIIRFLMLSRVFRLQTSQPSPATQNRDVELTWLVASSHKLLETCKNYHVASQPCANLPLLWMEAEARKRPFRSLTENCA